MEIITFPVSILNYEYNAPTLRILIALSKRVENDRRIKTFRQSDIAAESRTNQGYVSRSLDQFIKDKVISKNGYDYYLNEPFAAVMKANATPEQRRVSTETGKQENTDNNDTNNNDSNEPHKIKR